MRNDPRGLRRTGRLSIVLMGAFLSLAFWDFALCSASARSHNQGAHAVAKGEDAQRLRRPANQTGRRPTLSRFRTRLRRWRQRRIDTGRAWIAPRHSPEERLEKEVVVDQADIEAFFDAAQKGDLEKIKSIISRYPDAKPLVEAKDEQGNMPLHKAAIYGHSALAGLLIAKGADVNAKDSHGFIPLNYAVGYGHKEIVELLIASDPNFKVKDDLLRYSVVGGHKGIVELLIATDPNFKAKDDLLRDAVKYGHKSIFELLMTNDTNLEAKDNLGRTFLHLATIDAHKDLVEFLTAINVDCEARDNYGRRPLHYAVIYDHKDIGAFLVVEQDAVVNARDNFGCPPLHYALTRSLSGDNDLAQFLRENGADPRIAPVMAKGKQIEFTSIEGIESLNVEKHDIRKDFRHTDPNVKKKTLVFDVNTSEIRVYAAPEGYEYLQVGELQPLSRSGAPQVPMKTFVVKLNHESHVLGVEVVEGQFGNVKGLYKIIPGSRMEHPTYYGRLFSPVSTIHKSEEFFPGKLVRYDVGKDNLYNYVFLRFYPAQYVPKQEKLAIVTDARITLYYEEGKPQQSEAFRHSEAGDLEAINPSERRVSSTDAQCVIVCRENITPAADRLSEFHKREGIASAVVTVESIGATYLPAEDPPLKGYANRELKDWDKIVDYDYTLAKKVIAYLRDTSAHPDLEYVTIFGDAELVPASYFCLQTLPDLRGSRKTFWVGTDLFYTSPDYDFVPNYKFGRLPVSDNSEALRMVKKIENWHGHADCKWFRNVYFHGGLDKPHIPYAYVAREFDNDLMSSLLGGMEVRKSFLSQGGFKRADLASVLKGGNVGFVHHVGHGNPRFITAGADGYLWAREIMAYKKVDELPIVISSGCHTAKWYQDNLSEEPGKSHLPSFGEAVLKSEAGGIAYFGGGDIGKDVIHFYFDNGKVVVSKIAFSGAIFHYNIMRSYHQGGDTLGRLASDAIYMFVSDNDVEYSRNRYTVVTFNLLGDPALRIPTKCGKVRRIRTKPEGPARDEGVIHQEKQEASEGRKSEKAGESTSDSEVIERQSPESQEGKE